MPPSLGVIGLGRIAKALLSPLLERGDFLPEDVFAVVGNKGSVELALQQLPRGITVVSSDDPIATTVWESPMQLLAVKPQQLCDVNKSGFDSGALKNDSPPLLVSLLAGVTLKRLATDFPHHSCVRAVPNTPALVGAGLTGIAWSKGIDGDQKDLVKKIFTPISEVLDLPEDQLNPFLALTSSGPAYVALVAEALSDGAVAAGLPRSMASYLAHRTLAGTALLLKEKKLHPAELKDMVASPSGTTIAALRHLEKSGVRSAFIEGVVIAAERSREMA